MLLGFYIVHNLMQLLPTNNQMKHNSDLSAGKIWTQFYMPPQQQKASMWVL